MNRLIRAAAGLVLAATISQAVAEDWLTTFGGGAADMLRDLAVTSDGSVCVVGSFAHTARLGDLTLTSAGDVDGFVACFDASGRPRWAQRFGGVGADEAVAVSALGNRVLITGQLAEPGDFGAQRISPSGMTDVVVAALDGDGGWQWAHSLGGDYGDAAGDVLATDSGAVVLAALQRQAAFDPAWESAGRHDIALLGLKADGALRWHRRYGGSGREYASALLAGPGGEVYASGVFEGQAQFGDRTLTADSLDQFVMAVDRDGTPSWTVQMGSPAPDGPMLLAAAADGGLLTGTTFSERWSAPGHEPVTSAGLTDIVVSRLGADGQVSWTRRLGGEAAESLDAIAADGHGGAWLAGSFTGSTQIEDQALSTTDTDVFLVHLSATGDLQALQQFPSAGVERILALAVTDDGSVIAGGVFQGELALPGHRVARARGKTDLFLLRWSPPKDH